MDEETVKLIIASHMNVSFRHELDTGTVVSEWRQMSDDERREAIEDLVWEAIEVWEKDLSDGSRPSE